MSNVDVVSSILTVGSFFFLFFFFLLLLSFASWWERHHLSLQQQSISIQQEKSVAWLLSFDFFVLFLLSFSFCYFNAATKLKMFKAGPAGIPRLMSISRDIPSKAIPSIHWPMIIWSTWGGNLIFPFSFKVLITPSGSSSRKSAFVIRLEAVVVFKTKEWKWLRKILKQQFQNDSLQKWQVKMAQQRESKGSK